jgi:HSP20 family protein
MSRFSTSLLPVRPRSKNRPVNVNKPFPLDEFRNELENMFSRFWGGWLTPFGEDFGTFNAWDFNMTENEKEFVIKAELPGFEDKELEVKLSDNLLLIKAEKEEMGEEESGYKAFRRSLLLPFAIDYTKVRATYHHGVLELHIPKPDGDMIYDLRIVGY